MDAVYSIDSHAQLRKSHENPEVQVRRGERRKGGSQKGGGERQGRREGVLDAGVQG
jgi:hypothetical protein